MRNKRDTCSSIRKMLKLRRQIKLIQQWKLLNEQNYRIDKKNTKGRITLTY